MPISTSREQYIQDHIEMAQYEDEVPGVFNEEMKEKVEELEKQLNK